MKAAQNGVPNISVLDGWWDEGYDGRQRLGDRRPRDRTRTRRPRTGATPRTCTGSSRRRSSRPTTSASQTACRRAGSRSCAGRWRRALWRFSTTRMLHEYTERLYLPRGRRRQVAGRPLPQPRGHRGRLTRRVAPRISLALAIHNHQPVGNFGWVFAEVFDQAYEPMVEALERHPDVRLSLHYTGPLLEWLRAERPEFIERLRALVDRDQVEILGGGYYEPVLASLPERDRVGQLAPDGRRAEALFGRRPRGRVARRTGLGAGPARRRSSRPATTGRSSTTPTSAPRPSPRRTCGARTRPRTRAAPARLRDRAGPALPDPVPRRRGGHRLPPRPRDRGRATGSG